MQQIKNGGLEVEAAMKQLQHLPFEDLGYARIDHHRSLRSGMPEVIFCPGKSEPQILEIFGSLLKSGVNIIATRAEHSTFEAIIQVYPEAKYHQPARIITLEQNQIERRGLVVVVTAGTADVPVAEEAAITAEMLGNKVERIYDTGVAGIHRLFACRELLDTARVIIAVAGMEGALPSVIGGLVRTAVIAVPTSIGYGASFGGVAALLAMLNSCANGIGVVNIDNGFGAACLASRINRIGSLEDEAK